MKKKEQLEKMRKLFKDGEKEFFEWVGHKNTSASKYEYFKGNINKKGSVYISKLLELKEKLNNLKIFHIQSTNFN